MAQTLTTQLTISCVALFNVSSDIVNYIGSKIAVQWLSANAKPFDDLLHF